MALKSFVKSVPNFSELAPSNQIDYFAYFLLHEKKVEGIKPKEIQECFDELIMKPYSNIPGYLNKSSLRGKDQKFLKKKNLFFLENLSKQRIEQNIKKELDLDPSDNLFPQSIFNNTRGYLVLFAKEASCSYDYRLYNSCFFMIRKIIETLVIDLFEKYGLGDKIKNEHGNYVMLSELVTKLGLEKTWQLSKTVKQDIPKIKKLADSSVHSKNFAAKKPDIDNIKTDLRIILQELISLIDYSNNHK